MRVRLIPLDCAELSIIDIRDALFGVGRDRGDFKDLPAARSARLSERHARLYGKNGSLYVVDLGSEHGTFVNNQRVSDKSVELSDGDEINFGGELPFRLEIAANGGERAQPEGAGITLVLEPADASSGPDTLRIATFPFFVSKNAPAFAKYAKRAAAELEFISRRHAQILLHDGQLAVQDLGSTNGTFVDGQAVGDDPIPLRPGQKVAFGGDYFVYRIAVQGLPTPRPAATSDKKPAQDTDKTTFLAAGTSFLDILCTDGTGRDAQSDPSAATAGAAAEESASDTGSTPTRRRKPRASLARLDRRVWRRLQIAALAFLTVLGLVGYLALRDSPTERMETLLAEGRYDDALQIARASAAALAGDGLFDRLALRALVGKTLDPWLSAYDARDFAGMQSILEAGRAATAQQPGSLELMDTLAIIGTVEHAVMQRGGASAPLRVLDPASAEVRHIVEAWNRPLPDKRKVTQQLLGVVAPSEAALSGRYRDAYQKAASDIRALESQLSVYEPAVRQLEATLTQFLSDGSPEALDGLAAEIDRSRERYSQFEGFDRLQDDLTHYRALVTTLAEGRVLDAVELAATAQPQTAPFIDARQRLVQERLPRQAFLDAYRAALDAWRAGQVKDAMAQLEALTQDPSGEIAKREIARMRGIVDEVNALQAREPSSAYDEHLLGVYQTLDRSRDQFILTLLKSQYEDSLKAVAQRAQQAADAAAGAWTEYRGKGGISSTLRLRAGVSRDYKRLAETLSQAASAAREAQSLSSRTQRRLAETQRALLREIEREVALQHQALDELTGVVDESTLRSKHALLPERLKERPTE